MTWRGRAIAEGKVLCEARFSNRTVCKAAGAAGGCLVRKKRSWQEHRVAYEPCQCPSERGVCSRSQYYRLLETSGRTCCSVGLRVPLGESCLDLVYGKR